MQNIGSNSLKNLDQGFHLRSLFNDFLCARSLNSFEIIDHLKCKTAFDIFKDFKVDLTHSDRKILSGLLNTWNDPLNDSDTNAQNSILHLLKVDQFKASAPNGSLIKMTANDLKSDEATQIWFIKSYMQIGLLQLANSRGMKLSNEDSKTLRQYNFYFNKVCLSKFLSIYAFKIPLLVPLICALIVATEGNVPLSYTSNLFLEPLNEIGLIQFANNSGGRYFIVFSAVMFYTGLFKEQLLYKAFSLRTIYSKCLQAIKSRILTITLTITVATLFLTLLPQTAFYPKDSIGYLVAEGEYSKAYNAIESKQWHIEQKNYAKAQVLLAQKNTLPAEVFSAKFNAVTNQLVNDYKSGNLPNWANDFVVAKVLEERKVQSDLKTFKEASYYFIVCFFLYFVSYLFSSNTLNRVRSYKFDKKKVSKIKRMLY